MSVRMEAGARFRPGWFGLIVMAVSLSLITACAGTSGQGRSRGDSAAVEAYVQNYDRMVQEYERQNGPPDEGFWREVYKDSD